MGASRHEPAAAACSWWASSRWPCRCCSWPAWPCAWRSPSSARPRLRPPRPVDLEGRAPAAALCGRRHRCGPSTTQLEAAARRAAGGHRGGGGDRPTRARDRGRPMRLSIEGAEPAPNGGPALGRARASSARLLRDAAGPDREGPLLRRAGRAGGRAGRGREPGVRRPLLPGPRADRQRAFGSGRGRALAHDRGGGAQTC